MSTPLRTLVHDLLHEPEARAAFAADPAGYLGGHGWDDLDGDDVGAVFAELGHELPIDDAVRLGTVDTGAFGGDSAGALDGLRAAVAAFPLDWSADPSEGIDAGSFDDPAALAPDDAGTFDDVGADREPADDLDDEPDADVDEPAWDNDPTSWFDAPDDGLADLAPFGAPAEPTDDDPAGWADPEELDHG